MWFSPRIHDHRGPGFLLFRSLLPPCRGGWALHTAWGPVLLLLPRVLLLIVVGTMSCRFVLSPPFWGRRHSLFTVHALSISTFSLTLRSLSLVELSLSTANVIGRIVRYCVALSTSRLRARSRVIWCCLAENQSDGYQSTVRVRRRAGSSYVHRPVSDVYGRAWYAADGHSRHQQTTHRPL